MNGLFLIGVFLALNHIKHGKHDNIEVQGESPIFNVPDVMVDPFLHKLLVLSIAAIPVYLRPAGNSGFYQMAQ